MASALALCAVASGAAPLPPDPALLEFLGEWDDGVGGVVDWEALDLQVPAGAESVPDVDGEDDDATP